ncbi:SLC13/DASS family transporter [Exilibacterium tricleocarpae]|uniref:SLC13/DASS family transporter n=1 Tax=Exilibacterium tricleocarpae TaxID=2591008 RepID=A0A545TLL9_9GAMM|nr:SLC13 family permease [Exilibacterium tricleocarpae]TQV78127.1 SLC13/DASS family transporter [Exilibacterium tricleocarpae]
MVKRAALFSGPTLALITVIAMQANAWPMDAAIAAGVTVLCAVWWIFEALPIAATALIPIAVFTLTGVLTPAQVGQAYGSPIVLLMLAGFMLSASMEKSGAHRRLALAMVNLTGAAGGWRLVAGFMLAAAVLSMWISNTATALMLLPIALAVLEQSRDRLLAVAVMLGIAYGASVGGVATPIGTPTNLVFMQVYQETTGTELSFTQWMGMALPVTLVFLPIICWWITRRLARAEPLVLPDVGRWRAEEKRMLAVFSVTALLWITRKEPFGGWSELAGLNSANDASVGLLAAIALFLIPNGKGGKLLDWQSAERIPWGILILFGSGICIARSFSATGLSQSIGESLSGFVALPLLVTLGLICLAVTFLTEVTSNAATAVLLMPLLAAAALAAGIEPALLMVPAVISCSCAFMLPVATPPNAVAYSSGLFTITEMARVGVVLNFIGVMVVSLVTCFVLSNLVL